MKKHLTIAMALCAMLIGVAQQDTPREAAPKNVRTVFSQGNVRLEFHVNRDGSLKDCVTTVSKMQGGRVSGYEVITRIPRSDVELTTLDIEELTRAILGSPYDLPDSMLCVSIESGTLVEGEDGRIYMDIVIADCSGNVLDSRRKLVASIPDAVDFTLPGGDLPDLPPQDPNSEDGV